MCTRFNNCPSQPNRDQRAAAQAAGASPPETPGQHQPECLRTRQTPSRNPIAKGSGKRRGRGAALAARKEPDDPTLGTYTFQEPDSALKKQTSLRKKLEKEPDGINFRQDNFQLYIRVVNPINPIITSSDIIGVEGQY